MPESSTPTEQAPVATKPAETATPAASAAPVVEAPKPGDPAAGFKSEESKNAVLADLHKEREARQGLETKLAAFETSNEARNKALAEALGLTEAPKSEDLAETVKGLQQQIAASNLEATKLRIAAEFNIPAEHQDLLTETDPEKLKAQAEKVGALVAAKNAADGIPAFQANPGQGQGGAPADPVAAAAAEYGTYYPTPTRK